MFDERPSATEKEMAALRAIESLRDRREFCSWETASIA